MTQKTLITYATKLGSTAEIAQVMGKIITEKGVSVDIKPVKNITDISAYNSVVLGSAVRMGSWLSEAIDFAKHHQAALQKISVTIFTVHILNLENDLASEKERQAYTSPVREILTPAAEAFFAGKIDPAQLSFLEQLLFKAVKSPSGDYRNWDEIKSWANQQV